MRKLWNKIRGWKTVVFGITVGVLPVLDYVQAIDISPLFREEMRPYTGIMLGSTIILLRYLTRTGMFKED